MAWGTDGQWPRRDPGGNATTPPGDPQHRNIPGFLRVCGILIRNMLRNVLHFAWFRIGPKPSMLRMLHFQGGGREVPSEGVLELVPRIPSWGAIVLAEHPRPDAERFQLGRQPPRREP